MLRPAFFTTSLAALALVIADVHPASAQEPTRALEQPDATFPESFSFIAGLREFSDGRVLIADPLEQRLVIINMTAGTAEAIGRLGQGPGEYRQPDELFALSGDSTLLLDLGNARLSVITPELEFGETMPVASSTSGEGMGMLIILPNGVDSSGGIYFQPIGGRMRGGVPDSAIVALFDPASASVDSIATFKIADLERTASGSANNRSMVLRPVPLSPSDSWTVARDGRVAMVRSGDYHVEWIERDGSVIAGRPVSYRAVPVGRAEKEAWLEASAGRGVNVMMSVDNGERRMSFSRGGSSGQQPDIDSMKWPETMPPFVESEIYVTHEGDVWVERSMPAAAPVHIDIFGADANWKRQITLPAGREIVGFGARVVYLARTDDLGLQWLERYTY